MKAIRVSNRSHTHPCQLVELPVPSPAPETLLLRVRAAGINFADVMQLQGEYPRSLPTPYTPGYEVAGEVVELGRGATDFVVGDRVAAVMPAGGGFAEYAIVPQALAVRIPEQLGLAEATALLAQGLTAFIMVDKFVHENQAVLFTAAAGGVGTLALQLARHKRARTVYGATSSADKAKHIEELGAISVDYSEPDWAQALQRSSVEFDVIFDAVGGEALQQAWLVLKEFGSLVSYGNASGGVLHLDSAELAALPFKNHSLHFYGFTRHLERDLALYARGLQTLIALTQRGELRIPTPRAYPLSDAQLALADMLSRKTVGKSVLLT